MALRPPEDFTPADGVCADPGEAELLALWRRHEAARAERERLARWRRARELLRREPGGELRGAERLPRDLHDPAAIGPRARAALRPVPREGRVLAAGTDRRVNVATVLDECMAPAVWR